MPPEAAFAIDLPPTETIEFFRAKGHYPISRNWWDVWQEEHSRAFTVAGITSVSTLEDVRGSLDRVLAEGGTFEQWKADALPALQDAVDKGSAPPNILSDRRLRTIYETNLRMARAAGQWKRIEALKPFQPYLMYSAVNDGRTRPLHRKWGGLDPGTMRIVLPVDHPAWRRFYPPNGWGCRCDVIQLSERALKRLRLTVTPDSYLRSIGWPTTEEPDNIASRATVRGNGIVDDTPLGIDPGFAYNVGEAHLAGAADALRFTLERAAQKNSKLARVALSDIVETTAFDAFLVNEQQGFPVMVIDRAQRELLQSETSIATLSSQAYAQQQSANPALSIDVYRRLPDLAERPDFIFRQGDVRIFVAKTDDEKWLMASLQVTADKRGLSVVSVKRVDRREFDQLRLLWELVFDAGA